MKWTIVDKLNIPHSNRISNEFIRIGVYRVSMDRINIPQWESYYT